ncbi:MAG: fatty acid-binding protein DegV [Stenotrophomonas sp.]|jgi:DegV family protein with EDD domain|nr:MAG: fatty acid-binding protein DegV [Stenotrophomonas sp.]
MRIGIVVDSACDLPKGYLQQNNIVLLPISVRIGDTVLPDHRDEESTLAFLQGPLSERSAEAETIPYSAEQIRDLFLSRLVTDFDQVFCMTITRTRSPIHDNAVQAGYSILNEYKPIRQAAGHNSPFSLRVIDTQNLFAAQAVSAVEAVRLRDSGATVPQMRERLELVASNVHGYMVTRDLYYLRARARHKGDRSVGLLSVALGSALDIKPVLHGYRGNTEPVAKIKGFDNAVQALFDFVGKRVLHGLMTPVVCVSYGGPLDELRALPGYQQLRDTCDKHGVTLLEAVMSLTGMVNVGKGAVTIGFADEPHTFGS